MYHSKENIGLKNMKRILQPFFDLEITDDVLIAHFESNVRY